MTKALALLFLVAAIAAPAHAQRIAYYRLGAAVVGPGTVESPGRYSTGYGFNAGVSVPFMHRLALTLDVGHDRLNWDLEDTIQLLDLTITSGTIGLDVAFRRGGVVRPMVSAGVGVARLEPHVEGLLFAPPDPHPEWEPRTVLATTISAGVRFRLPGEHRAVRVQVGWMGLSNLLVFDGPFGRTREEFAYTIPIRAQLEF